MFSCEAESDSESDLIMSSIKIKKICFSFWLQKVSLVYKAKRIEYLKKLLSIYDKDYTHEVYNEAKGTHEEYTILIH